MTTKRCPKCAERFNPRTLAGAAHLAGCRQYNGWRNYSTWLVITPQAVVHVLLEEIRRLAERARSEAGDRLGGRPAVILADLLKEYVNDGLGADEDEPGSAAPSFDNLAGGLSRAGLGEVEWLDIARHLLADVEAPRAVPQP